MLQLDWGDCIGLIPLADERGTERKKHKNSQNTLVVNKFHGIRRSVQFALELC